MVVRWPSVILGGLCLLIAGQMLAGCSKSYPIHARMNEESVRAVLDEHFATGMTVEQVDQQLTDLRVGEEDRVRYNMDAGAGHADAPPQLLARVYEAGGFWVRGQDDTVRITDLIFVFGEDSRYERSEVRRYRLRYFDNMLVNRLPYEPAYKPQRFPHKPPPPKDPPVGQ